MQVILPDEQRKMGSFRLPAVVIWMASREFCLKERASKNNPRPSCDDAKQCHSSLSQGRKATISQLSSPRRNSARFGSILSTRHQHETDIKAEASVWPAARWSVKHVWSYCLCYAVGAGHIYTMRQTSIYSTPYRSWSSLRVRSTATPILAAATSGRSPYNSRTVCRSSALCT
jgi:hypothetical protein